VEKKISTFIEMSWWYAGNAGTTNVVERRKRKERDGRRRKTL